MLQNEQRATHGVLLLLDFAAHTQTSLLVIAWCASKHMSELFSNSDVAVLERRITEWLFAMKDRNEAIAAVDKDQENHHRWFVRLRGEEKEFTTVWLTLGQRTLRYETYVMPAPEENAEALYEHVLRRNESLVGAHFSIGVEDAIFLRGELPLRLVDEPELDRVVGTLYATVERVFPAIIRIGFASKFAD
jgi:hypothetical protein